jgi:hypothetical protein
LRQQCKDICDERTLMLVLTQLKMDGKVVLIEAKTKEKVCNLLVHFSCFNENIPYFSEVVGSIPGQTHSSCDGVGNSL